VKKSYALANALKINAIEAKVIPIKNNSGGTNHVVGCNPIPNKNKTINIAVPDMSDLLAAHSISANTMSSKLSGVCISVSHVLCTCIRENAEYKASNEAAIMTDIHIDPLARYSIYVMPLIYLIRLPSPYPNAINVMSGSAILPITLATASFFHTKKLRCHTGAKRRLNAGSS
jgi:hypothetical protein